MRVIRCMATTGIATHLAKAHLVGQAPALLRTSLLIEHPGNANDLVRHERNLHAGRERVEGGEAELVQCLLDARISVEELSVARGDKEFINAAQLGTKNCSDRAVQ